jgi:hypothetical protein
MKPRVTAKQYRQLSAEEKVEVLESKLGQAYQIIGTLLAGVDGKDLAFHTKAGQAVLTYFSTDTYDDDFLPWAHPMAPSLNSPFWPGYTR